MRILTVTSLYPNVSMPGHGVFVENRLRHLVADGDVDLRVVAPVPWFPVTNPRFGQYARWAGVPASEARHGIEITHPRYLTLPKFGMALQPSLMFRALARHVPALLRRTGDVDLIDIHYFYPDGVAGAWLAAMLGKPCTITARGTDISLIPLVSSRARRLIVEAASSASAAVTVCQALNDALVGLGVPAMKVHTLRNGVDLELFQPRDRALARSALGVDGPLLLSVGHLVERKGHHLIVEALADLSGVTLLIAGDGPERGTLERTAERAGVADRVRFLGAVAHEQLAEIYSAADVLVLASSREGWANVLLEAMACGTPVAATDIWGTPEVVATPEAGRLIPERTAKAIAATVQRLLAELPDRAATRAYAGRFSWDATTAGQKALFRRVVDDWQRERG